jgi:hypothetical protein
MRGINGERGSTKSITQANFRKNVRRAIIQNAPAGRDELKKMNSCSCIVKVSNSSWSIARALQGDIFTSMMVVPC